jgi:hypothetical protein
MHQKFKVTALAFTLLIICFSANAIDKKGCVGCNDQEVASAITSEKKDGLTRTVQGPLSEDESFDEYYKLYCMRFEQLSNNYAFKKDMLEHMRKSPYPVDRYWTEASCRPSRIGGTASPIIHLVAEEVGGRRQFIDLLYKYYQERKDNNAWLDVVNAKNTIGFTILDYIDWLDKSKGFMDEERDDMNDLIKFLCERGGKYSDAKHKKCH